MGNTTIKTGLYLVTEAANGTGQGMHIELCPMVGALITLQAEEAQELGSLLTRWAEVEYKRREARAFASRPFKLEKA